MQDPSSPDQGRKPARPPATREPPAGLMPRGGKRSGGNARIIARAVAELIEAGHYPPGAFIREQDVSQHFGVSRSPVREAFRILESKWLVKIEPRRGARVTSLTDAELADVTLIRGHLFALAAGRAAVSATAEERRTISALAGRLDPDNAQSEPAPGESVPASLAAAILRFAGQILSASHSAHMIEAVTAYSQAGPTLFFPLALHEMRHRKAAVKLCRQLGEAVVTGDPGAAERTARKLASDSLDAAVETLARLRISGATPPSLLSLTRRWGYPPGEKGTG